MDYQIRHIDQILDEIGSELPAILLDGPKAVGKTSTALQRARTVKRLDDLRDLERLKADPEWAIKGEAPILIDEWQKAPEVWDTLKRDIDLDSAGGRFLLTGSLPSDSTHSGALRITSLRMRPLTLAERINNTLPVSLRELLDGKKPELDAQTDWVLGDYVEEISKSGFPAIRKMSPRARSLALEGYVQRIIDTDLPELGQKTRLPETIRSWMASYAAATATTASWETIRDGANAGFRDKPAKSTMLPYRDALIRLRILDEVPAWLPSNNLGSRLSQAPKHFLADPALATNLLGLDPQALEATAQAGQNSVKPLLGRLFEALAILSIRVYAETNSARVFHFRDGNGRREIDLIIVRNDGKILPVEIKMSAAPRRQDGENLRWLKNKLGDQVIDMVIIHTGKYAYRSEGIAYIPLAALGA